MNEIINTNGWKVRLDVSTRRISIPVFSLHFHKSVSFKCSGKRLPYRIVAVSRNLIYKRFDILYMKIINKSHKVFFNIFDEKTF